MGQGIEARAQAAGQYDPLTHYNLPAIPLSALDKFVVVDRALLPGHHDRQIP